MLPYLLLVFTVLFWSGNFVLGRGIHELIPPVSLNFWRWAGALLILLPFGLPHVRRQKALIARHWRYIAMMSVPAITIFNAFIYKALNTVTTTNTVLVNAMIPVFIGLMAWIGFGERLSARQICGVAISFCGLVVVITRGAPASILQTALSTGDLWTLCAGLCWALYSVLLRLRPPALHPLSFLTCLVAFGLAFLLPLYIWETRSTGGFQVSSATLAGLAYVALFPSVLSYIFYNKAVGMVGANRAGIFFHLMPVFSILLAVVFLGERIRWYHLWGMALIFTGIGLTAVIRAPVAAGNR